jgi:signal transduction histidine kinase
LSSITKHQRALESAAEPTIASSEKSCPLPASIAEQLQRRVKDRFGVLPNFFRVSPETPEITEKLWGFAQAAYLDNPLPSLFKERLFVLLSRYCAVRYCIARHTGFLVGMGRPAGDRSALPEKVVDVINLLRRPLPRGPELESRLSFYLKYPAPLIEMPMADMQMEDGLFSLACHVFLQTADAPACLAALERLLGTVRLQYLLLFLTFVRAAHYWTKVHPEIEFEDDINQLLATHEELASCILADPEIRTENITQSILDELPVLRQRADQLRDFSGRLMRAQDEERRRIARDLHDSVGQNLAALAMNLGIIANGAKYDPMQLSQSIEDAQGLVRDLVQEIRTTSYLLHPPMLEEGGLLSALRWYIDGLMERGGLNIELNIPENLERFAPDIELAIFRLVQECLTNIHRHSGSKTAIIRITHGDDKIDVEVQDHGKGISQERLAEVQSHGVGVGIGGMRERVRQSNGELTIESNALGTKITAIFPVSAPTLSEP